MHCSTRPPTKCNVTYYGYNYIVCDIKWFTSSHTTYLKESETDQRLFSNILYLKKSSQLKMGAEVLILPDP